MEYCSSAGSASCKFSAVFFKLIYAALLPRILSAADNYSVLILPKIKAAALSVDIEQHILESKVMPWVEGISDYQTVHTCSCGHISYHPPISVLKPLEINCCFSSAILLEDGGSMSFK